MKRSFTRLALAMALFAGTTTANAAETLVVDGTKAYDQELVQGADYILPGTDETWYAQPEFFTRNADGSWKFNAYQYTEYSYTIKLDENLKYIDVDEIVGEPSEENVKSATWAAGITAALWMNGGHIGFPSWETNDLQWSEHLSWSGANSVPFAQIDYLKYRMTLILGEQLDPSHIDFKFYMGNKWGGDVYPTFASMEENDYIQMGASDGNFAAKADAVFSEGDTLIINLDMTNGEGNGKFTIDYRKYVPKDFPTFNGKDMELSGSFWYATVELTQGQEFTIANEQVVDMNMATAYIDPVAATNLGGGKYKFNGVSGTYTIALMPRLNYVKIFPGTIDAPATYENGKALWIIGNQVGMPSFTDNASGWGASLNNSIPVTQVAENIYKITFTVGQELASSVNIKFFGQYGWGKEFRHYDLTMEPNDYLTINAPEGTWTYDEEGNDTFNYGGDDGNIFNGSLPLSKGDKLTLTIDLNGFEFHTVDAFNQEIVSKPGKITVEYEPYAGPMPTVNGQAMASIDGGYKYVGYISAGNTLTFGGDVAEVLDLIKSADFFYNYDYLTKIGDTSFTFNAISGRYAIELDQAKKYFRIYPVNEDNAAANFSEGATWVCGDANIGFPSVAVNRNYWGGDYGWAQNLGISISPAAVNKNFYRLTLTVGKQINAGSEFKFYDAYNYNYEGGPNGDGLNSEELIDINTDLVSFNGANMKFSEEVAAGDTYVFILDRTGEKASLRVEKATDETGAGVDLPSSIQSVTTSQADNAVYNLQGVRVAAPTKGIYIQNGRKIVVK